MTATPPPPFQLHDIAFAYPGNHGTIPLRDPRTNRFLGDEPEWSAQGRSVTVAFVRGSRPKVRVRFFRPPGSPRKAQRVTVGARCDDGPGVAERTVTLRFDRTGISQPHEFRLTTRIHNVVGMVDHELDWYAREGDRERPLGITRHEWLRAYSTPIPATDWASLKEPRDGPVGQPNVPWVYLPIMRWTCEWATEMGDEVKVCDALLDRLPSSGLKYAVPAWNVRDMLIKGGGYCGAFYRMFQALAGSQGIHLERRQFGVDWRVEPKDQVRWCAIVVETPGLNLQEPAEGPSTFHDVDRRPVAKAPVELERQRRYRFWGVPGAVGDGHSINFLRSSGCWYIYDASFQLRVELRGFRLPRSNPKYAIPVERLGNFKAAYLDKAVNFMLGSLDHEGKLLETVHPDPNAPGFKAGSTRNGLSLKISLIPNRGRVITFYWQ